MPRQQSQHATNSGVGRSAVRQRELAIARAGRIDRLPAQISNANGHDHVDSGHRLADGGTHSPVNTGVASSGRRVVSDTAASSITHINAAPSHDPVSSGSQPGVSQVRAQPQSLTERHTSGIRLESVTTRTINAPPIKIVNTPVKKYRGADPIKRAVSNPKLRAILAGKPLRSRKKDQPILRGGLRRIEVNEYVNCDDDESEH